MNYEKLSASMAVLIDEMQTQTAVSMMAGPRAVPLADTDPAAPPLVFTSIRCNVEAELDQVPGVHMHRHRGNIRTALASLSGINELSERESVYLISPSVLLKPLNNIAAQKTAMVTFKNNVGRSGRGVIVGVVDSGIDSTHPAFSGRIHSIWDQTISGMGWGTTNYGTVLSGPSIVASSDTNGHGTHVAGTAAGSDPNFGGVAPDADLVIVKTNFLHTGIIDGIRYIFAIADQLGRPAVVNLSLGGHHDAHDGSDDLSTFIDGRSGPGRIVVAAAGNEGNDDIHSVAIIPASQTTQIPFQVPPNSQPGSPPFVRLNGWYGQNTACEISVRTSSGDDTPFQPVIFAASTAFTHNFSNASVRISTPPPTATPNGDHHFLVELLPAFIGGLVQGGTWRLRIRNTGANDARVDVWSIVPAGFRDATFPAPFNSTDKK